MRTRRAHAGIICVLAIILVSIQGPVVSGKTGEPALIGLQQRLGQADESEGVLQRAFRVIQNALNSIITTIQNFIFRILGKDQHAPLTPARDLEGTWTSSLQGKGIEFTPDVANPNLLWTGDLEIEISYNGDVPTGTLTMINLEGSPLISSQGPRSMPGRFEYKMYDLVIEESSIMFTAGDPLSVWRGTFTENNIHGTVYRARSTSPPDDGMKGEFNLKRGKTSTQPPAGGLAGTWRNKVQGKGVVWVEESLSDCEYSADLEIVIQQSGNTLSGTVRRYNIKVKPLASGDTCPPLVETDSLDVITSGTVTASGIQFTAGGFNWQATVDSGIMSGTVQGTSSLIEKYGEFSVMNGTGRQSENITVIQELDIIGEWVSVIQGKGFEVIPDIEDYEFLIMGDLGIEFYYMGETLMCNLTMFNNEIISQTEDPAQGTVPERLEYATSEIVIEDSGFWSSFADPDMVWMGSFTEDSLTGTIEIAPTSPTDPGSHGSFDLRRGDSQKKVKFRMVETGTEWIEPGDYELQDTFPRGYGEDLLVIYEIEDHHHDLMYRVSMGIYITSNGETVLEAHWSDEGTYSHETDWYHSYYYPINISGLGAGEYTVEVSITDLMNGESSSSSNTFMITP